MVTVFNFTPMPRYGYRVGVPAPGRWQERLNTDASLYGGSDLGNGGWLEAEPVPWMGRPWSVNLTLPPLGAVVLVPEAV